MMKKLTCLLTLASLLFACGNDPKDSNFQQVEANMPVLPTGASPTEQLSAMAIEESNYLERVRQSFVPLQEEYRKAKGKVPGIGEVTIFVDDNFTLLIENKFEGSTYQTKVNLKNLNNAQGGMRLVPDNNPGDFPGLRIFVKDKNPGVEIIKDGKLVKEERQLEIYLADRASIERVTPAVLQGLNIANGNVPD